MGVNAQQNDYYESLFRRTTASYRAKINNENDKRGGPHKRKSFDIQPTCNKQASGENRKALCEINRGEASTSSGFLNGSHSKSQPKKEVETKINERTLKILVEKSLAQILRDKYSQEYVEKDDNIDKEKSPIRSIVEQVLKEKLANVRHLSIEKLDSSVSGSLKSIIEDAVTKVLNEKLLSVEKENAKSKNRDAMKNLNHDKKQINGSKEPTITFPRESVSHYNKNKKINSKSLVQQLLTSEGAENKNDQNTSLKISKADKENSTKPPMTECIKRLQRSPGKQPQWQDPSLHDKILDKPLKAIRSQSPMASSSAHSSRSKCSSSVLVPRAKSQGRKPNSDPVALYQYYKNEWEHFRKQIPGETRHSRLRWHVRQRLLDPE